MRNEGLVSYGLESLRASPHLNYLISLPCDSQNYVSGPEGRRRSMCLSLMGSHLWEKLQEVCRLLDLHLHRNLLGRCGRDSTNDQSRVPISKTI